MYIIVVHVLIHTPNVNSDVEIGNTRSRHKYEPNQVLKPMRLCLIKPYLMCINYRQYME